MNRTITSVRWSLDKLIIILIEANPVIAPYVWVGTGVIGVGAITGGILWYRKRHS
jgi:hypothetical protein